MAEPFIGEIKLVPYNFAPRGWAFCHGQLLSISQNQTLFSLLGTTYGGDGRSTFALPDLRGRIALHRSTSYPQGLNLGLEEVLLSRAQLPAHSHDLAVSDDIGTLTSPSGRFPARSPMALGYAYGTTGGGSMPIGTVEASGGSLPHPNMQPYLVLNYVIALQGIFPPRN